MRIIAGSAKGRRLKAPPKKSSIRPILSRIRQSLFDTIRTRVPASYFLDLYAGTGLVGFEAISRGAGLVVFVEKGGEGLRLINDNISRMNCADRVIVQKGDVLGGALWMLKTKLKPGVLFDIVFVAPPYLGKDRRGPVLPMSVATLEKLSQSGVLQACAWVIMQHHQKEPWGDLPQGFKIWRRVKYGESILTYLEWKP